MSRACADRGPLWTRLPGVDALRGVARVLRSLASGDAGVPVLPGGAAVSCGGPIFGQECARAARRWLTHTCDVCGRVSVRAACARCAERAVDWAAEASTYPVRRLLDCGHHTSSAGSALTVTPVLIGGTR